MNWWLCFISAENADSLKLLTNLNNKSEWIWKMYFICMVSVILNTFSMAAMSIALRWMLHDDFDVKYFYHPIKLMWVMPQILCVKVSDLQISMNENFCVVCLLQITMESSHTLGLFDWNEFQCAQFWMLFDCQRSNYASIHVHMLSSSSIL